MTYTRKKVAYIIAEIMNDTCACNFNGIDEWLPLVCDYRDTSCPNPQGAMCWEQYLKHKSKERNAENERNN